MNISIKIRWPLALGGMLWLALGNAALGQGGPPGGQGGPAPGQGGPAPGQNGPVPGTGGPTPGHGGQSYNGQGHHPGMTKSWGHGHSGQHRSGHGTGFGDPRMGNAGWPRPLGLDRHTLPPRPYPGDYVPGGNFPYPAEGYPPQAGAGYPPRPGKYPPSYPGGRPPGGGQNGPYGYYPPNVSLFLDGSNAGGENAIDAPRRSRATYRRQPFPAGPDASVLTIVPTQPTAAVHQERAEAEFRRQQYESALKHVEHALVEDPQNGALRLFQVHIFTSLAAYDSASAALHDAVPWVHPDGWDDIVARRAELFAPGDFEHTLDRLRAAAQDEPSVPLLLGYHLLFLDGSMREASAQLARVDPEDQVVTALRPWLDAQGQDPEPLPEPTDSSPTN